MNWDAISAIGQIVGAFGVIVSVIYLAQQVRSNARQTRLASMRMLSEAFNQWLYGLAGNPQIGELSSRHARLCIDRRRRPAALQRVDGFSVPDLRRYVLPEAGRPP